MITKCEFCGKEMLRKPCHEKKGHGRFCSRSCWGSSRKIVIVPLERKCAKCNCIQTIDDFPINKSKPGLHDYYCKKCTSDMQSVYFKNNRQHLLGVGKIHYQLNKESYRLSTKKWINNHRDEYNASRREYYNNNIKIKIHHSISHLVRHSLRGGKKSKVWEILDFDLAALVNHLEKQFEKGMTWENYGEWHIDHKIPMAVFNFAKPTDIDFKKCWSLKNLQPLWAKDNMSKQDKLKSPFQPSLII